MKQMREKDATKHVWFSSDSSALNVAIFHDKLAPYWFLCPFTSIKSITAVCNEVLSSILRAPYRFARSFIPRFFGFKAVAPPLWYPSGSA
ncbi:MAG: hypothetical protein ACR652_07925 [Methylocystis sp.]|uniref:hypothetical protein n=1 Tax=Methylocystis sp. TaxID=1911079 RepID=UPI003DA2CB47